MGLPNYKKERNKKQLSKKVLFAAGAILVTSILFVIIFPKPDFNNKLYKDLDNEFILLVDCNGGIVEGRALRNGKEKLDLVGTVDRFGKLELTEFERTVEAKIAGKYIGKIEDSNTRLICEWVSPNEKNKIKLTLSEDEKKTFEDYEKPTSKAPSGRNKSKTNSQKLKDWWNSL